MTNTCNLRCRYCPYTINEQRGQGKMHASHHLKEEDARKAISDYFHEYTRIFRKVEPEHRTLFLKRNPPAVSFYGGEALLRFSLLEPLVKYVLSLPWEEHHIPAEKVVFHITTNATLLTRKWWNSLYGIISPSPSASTVRRRRMTSIACSKTGRVRERWWSVPLT